ncbi:MAG: hypothetical protein OTJ43_01230 [Dehalococcoidia bacterium]|nr:hypothetical protein [Dehalococcoidia bacterium]
MPAIDRNPRSFYDGFLVKTRHSGMMLRETSGAKISGNTELLFKNFSLVEFSDISAMIDAMSAANSESTRIQTVKVDQIEGTISSIKPSDLIQGAFE